MSNLRGKHWKKRLIRRVIALGTITSLCASSSFANPPVPPGLPGLPGLPSTVESPSTAPRLPNLQAVPDTQPGSSLQAAPLGRSTSASVGIKLLPAIPPASLPTNALPKAGASSEKSTVVVKMGSVSGAMPQNAVSAGIAVVNEAAPVSPSAPMTIANEKTQAAGPVKLSIGDSGIVDLGVQRPRQETMVTSRAPELVKPKKFSVAQPVVLAQAAEIQETDSTSGTPTESSVAVPQLFPSGTAASGLPSVETLPAIADTADAAAPATQSVNLTQPRIPNTTPSAELTVVAQTPLTNSLVPPGSLPQTSPASSSLRTAAPQTERTVAPEATKIASSQMDPALRQFALRNKPEKTYDIESRGTYSIDVPFPIASVAALDQDICTAFNNGNSITIAGGSTGTTRVAVCSQTGETRLIEVNVLPVGKQFSRPQNEIDQVKDLIGKVFPDARVQIVSLPTGEVEVKGTTTTESDARKILELVRKVCLVPVHDRLKSNQ